MGIDKDTVREAAKLAKLNLTETEAVKLAYDFETILGYFENIKNEDLTGCESDFLCDCSLELRDDEAKAFQDNNGLLKGTRQAEDGHIAIPRMLNME